MKPSPNFAPGPITLDELQGTPLAHLPPITETMIDPHGAINQPEVLPGLNGVPYRGKQIPHLKRDDPAHAQPQEGKQGHAAVFDLTDPKQLQYYQTLFHMVYNDRAIIGQDRIDFCPTTGKYMAFVRWAFPYCYMKPNALHPQN